MDVKDWVATWLGVTLREAQAIGHYDEPELADRLLTSLRERGVLVVQVPVVHPNMKDELRGLIAAARQGLPPERLVDEFMQRMTAELGVAFVKVSWLDNLIGALQEIRDRAELAVSEGMSDEFAWVAQRAQHAIDDER